MKQKKALPLWLSIVFAVLCVAAIGVNILQLPKVLDFGAALIATRILDCVAYLLALLYCVAGYRKTSAGLFHFFSAAYALSLFCAVCYWASSGVSLSLITSLVAYGALIVFAIARDLGKVRSFILSAVVLICSAFDAVIALRVGLAFGLPLAAKFVLALIFFLMILAKYADKAQRGSK